LNFGRIDLDGVGSPAGIAKRIHELAPDLPAKFDLEALCTALDIASVAETDVSGFEAALVMDSNGASGSILLASGRRPERHRFSIGHELGHFLIEGHAPTPGERHGCSLDHFHLHDTREKDRRRRIEAEANRFAGQLMMPRNKLRGMMTAREPDLAEIVSLAAEFGVSKEAMARSYVEASRHTIAAIVTRHGRIERVYRQPDVFPWIEPGRGAQVPFASIAADDPPAVRRISEIAECDPDVWLSEYAARGVEVLTEQVMWQSQGYAMVLLNADLSD
jgi:hypothetical protein